MEGPRRSADVQVDRQAGGRKVKEGLTRTIHKRRARVQGARNPLISSVGRSRAGHGARCGAVQRRTAVVDATDFGWFFNAEGTARH
jgi:hypothetical protein